MVPNHEPDYNARHFPRWEVINKITYIKENGVNFHECASRNISNTGVCLRTYEKIIPNKKLFMTIQLEDGVSVHTQGRTVWEKNDGGDFLIGVRFEEISEKIQDMIFSCVFASQPKQFKEKWFEGV